jgi:SpoVK/Ycf46/Vps4 family AAA+-type ATPase
LTKLQDLHDAAQKNEFIFILGTNYFDRIDSAAKRSGRIDHDFPIVYPDLHSRGYIIIRYLTKSRAPQRAEKTSTEELIKREFNALQELLASLQNELERRFPELAQKPLMDLFATFTGFLSYPKLLDLSKRFAKLNEEPVHFEKYFNAFIEDLRMISEGRSERYKPEINLSDYSERFEALDEIVRVARVIPNESFPWIVRAQNRREPRKVISPFKAQLGALSIGWMRYLRNFYHWTVPCGSQIKIEQGPQLARK